MRKCNKLFHAHRNSGRRVWLGFTEAGAFRFEDTCPLAHKVVHDKALQFHNNALLKGMLHKAGV